MSRATADEISSGRCEGKLCRYWRDVWRELRLTSWPSRRQLVAYTAAVLSFLAVAVAGVWLADLGTGSLMLQMLG